jgi:tetratricopeptide (TPR) repeat protein
MKSFNIIISLIAVLAFTLVAAEKSQAQDDPRAEAIQLYNQAQELAGGGDFDGASEKYREALDVARDNDLDDIVELVEQQLPRVAFQKASTSFSTFQNDRSIENANTALDDFKNAKEVGEEFGDEQIVSRAESAIPQLYYLRGVMEYRAENYDASLEDLDTAMELNANYPAPYYQKAVVLKAQNPDDIETALEWYDQAIEVAERAGDDRTLQNARSGARDELIFRAVNQAEERRFSQAVELLQRVEQYDPRSATAHYRLAEVYNERGNWDSALEHANRALEYESGGAADLAKIYFEIGTAYKGKGEKENACEAFENARYGDFTDPANHELQFELRCEGHSPTGR